MIESGVLNEGSRQRGIVRLFQTQLLDQLDVLQFSNHLHSRNVLSDNDMDEIRTDLSSNSSYSALVCMISRMQCHLPPDEWYYYFLCTLRELDHNNLIEMIEPDFLSNESALMPKLGKKCITPQTCYQGNKTETAFSIMMLYNAPPPTKKISYIAVGGWVGRSVGRSSSAFGTYGFMRMSTENMAVFVVKSN